MSTLVQTLFAPDGLASSFYFLDDERMRLWLWPVKRGVNKSVGQTTAQRRRARSSFFSQLTSSSIITVGPKINKYKKNYKGTVRGKKRHAALMMRHNARLVISSTKQDDEKMVELLGYTWFCYFINFEKAKYTVVFTYRSLFFGG